MNAPRAHHYCPKFYLENFTQDSALYVHDIKKIETRKSKPANEAHQRDFYKIEVKDGADPFYLEKEFAKIEYGANLAITHVSSKIELPKDKLLIELLNFIGTLAVRTPKFRKSSHNLYEGFIKKVMAITLFNKISYDRILAEVLEKDPNLPKDVTYEQMAEFIEKDEYSIERHQNDQILSMLSAANTITNCLLLRNWRLIYSPDLEFITSDSPVSLWWTSQDTIRSPGHGVAGTTVSVPLTKNIIMSGTFEDLQNGTVTTVDKITAAKYNTMTLSRMSRFSYSPKDDFCWYQNEISHVQDLFEAFKSFGEGQF